MTEKPQLGVVGLAALAEVIDRKETQRSGYAEINSILWEDGEDKIIRFISDDVRTVKMHSYTLCRDGSRKTFICPNQTPDGGHDPSGPCLICKYYERESSRGKKIPDYPSDRSIALVALRNSETAKVDGRVTTKIVDILHDGPKEVEIDGKTEIIENLPVVGLLNHGMRFWANIVTLFARYGTIADRDFVITRRGKKTDTTYGIAPLDRSDSPDLDTPEKVEERYAKAALAHMSLDDYISRFSSLDFQRAFAMVPESEQINRGGDSDEKKAETQGAEAQEADDFDSLAAKLRGLQS